MSIYVEIHSTDVDAFNFIDKKTGENRQMRKQVAWLCLPNEPYPQRCKVNLADNQAPYQKGKYKMIVKPFVDRWGSPDFSFDLLLSTDTKAA